MRRVLKILVPVVLLLALGGLGIALVVYPPEYVYRLLAWRNSDIGDLDRFASQSFRASPEPFVFPASGDRERVKSVFARLEAAAQVVEGGGGGDTPDLDAFLESSETQAFLVLEDGRLLYEGYFNGASHETIVTSFSAAKSFVSAVVGIAVAEGSIASVDDPITHYLPELEVRDPTFAGITVRDLLHMSSGIRYEEFPFFHGDDAKTYYYPDLRALALEETEIEGSPRAVFHYNNYHPLLLGLILERATGVPVASYLEERLWRPLGMEYEGSWSLDSPHSGFPKMESGINARAVDFAKFGQLFLDEGSWSGEQLIPADWVALSTTPAPARPGYYPEEYAAEGWSLGYGLMWWTLEATAAGGAEPGAPASAPGRYFMAWGKYGQIIFVSPDDGVAIVRNGAAEGISLERWFRLLAEFAHGLSR